MRLNKAIRAIHYQTFKIIYTFVFRLNKSAHDIHNW